MGSSAYWYFVPYENDFNEALKKLREREFKAGRYYPVLDEIEFPITEQSPAPGKQHASIAEAIKAADAEGSRSILDLERVEDKQDYGIAELFPREELNDMLETSKPTHVIIEENLDDILEVLDRGMGVCIVVYEKGKPSELFFAGMSYD